MTGFRRHRRRIWRICLQRGIAVAALRQIVEALLERGHLAQEVGVDVALLAGKLSYGVDVVLDRLQSRLPVAGATEPSPDVVDVQPDAPPSSFQLAETTAVMADHRRQVADVRRRVCGGGRGYEGRQEFDGRQAASAVAGVTLKEGLDVRLGSLGVERFYRLLQPVCFRSVLGNEQVVQSDEYYYKTDVCRSFICSVR